MIKQKTQAAKMIKKTNNKKAAAPGGFWIWRWFFMKFYATYKEITEKFDGESRILTNKVYEYCDEEAALLQMIDDFKAVTNHKNVEIEDIEYNSAGIIAGGKRYLITAEFIS